MRLHPLLLVSLLQLGACASCATDTAPDPEPAHYLDTGVTMAAFTFTADAGTDLLTITGHGLNTGDGPVAVRNVGGALPVGLAPVTNYFVIRVGTDTLKLATSSSNAHAGTSIDLTTNGTGTNILEIGIPFRRARTYAPGVQLFSADLNAFQDTFVALHDLVTGQAQSVWSDTSLAVPITLSGTTTLAGKTTISGALEVASIITPPALSSAAADYSPTGIGTATVLRLSTSGGTQNIGGIAAGTNAHRILRIVNLGPDDITLTHEDVGSIAQNRFALPGNTTVTLTVNATKMLWFDLSSLRWRVAA